MPYSDEVSLRILERDDLLSWPWRTNRGLKIAGNHNWVPFCSMKNMLWYMLVASCVFPVIYDNYNDMIVWYLFNVVFPHWTSNLWKQGSCQWCSLTISPAFNKCLVQSHCWVNICWINDQVNHSLPSVSYFFLICFFNNWLI